MTAFVVDTNVAVVANERESPQAGPECVIACIDQLAAIRDNAMIVLDDAGLILEEYGRRLNRSGQPGAGDMFLKWVWTVQADRWRCERVRITPMAHDPGDFDEFPRDTDLAGFDRSDRKFVAVALASLNDPTIVNAVDSDWKNFHAALAKYGVKIKFLCPQYCSPEI